MLSTLKTYQVYPDWLHMWLRNCNKILYILFVHGSIECPLIAIMIVEGPVSSCRVRQTPIYCAMWQDYKILHKQWQFYRIPLSPDAPNVLQGGRLQACSIDCHWLHLIGLPWHGNQYMSKGATLALPVLSVKNPTSVIWSTFAIVTVRNLCCTKFSQKKYHVAL